MPIIGGTRAVLNEVPQSWEDAVTSRGIGAQRVQLYTIGGVLKGQYSGHPPRTIADLTGSEEAATGVPSGAIFLWMGLTSPVGYLLCDGAAVSSTIYTGLFAAIGTSWGSGEGSNSFNVPNLAGRVPVGAGAPTFFDTWNGALTPGVTGGELGTELTNRHMPEHTHKQAPIAGHTHSTPEVTLDNDDYTLGANHAHNFDIDGNVSEPYDSADATPFTFDYFLASEPYDSGDTAIIDTISTAADDRATATSGNNSAADVTGSTNEATTGNSSIDDLTHTHSYETISDWEMYGVPTSRYDTYEGDFQFNDTDSSGLDMADTFFVIGRNDTSADDTEIDDTFVYSDFTTTAGLNGVGAALHTHEHEHTHTIPDHTHDIDAVTLAHSHDIDLSHSHRIPAAHHHTLAVDGQTAFTAPIITGDITVPGNTTGPSELTEESETGSAGESIPDKVSVIQPFIVVNYIIKA